MSGGGGGLTNKMSFSNLNLYIPSVEDNSTALYFKVFQPNPIRIPLESRKNVSSQVLLRKISFLSDKISGNIVYSSDIACLNLKRQVNEGKTKLSRLNPHIKAKEIVKKSIKIIFFTCQN